MNNPLGKIFNRATDFSGSKTRKFSKGIIGVVIVILLGALGLELSNTDFDLGSILSGDSVSESKIMRDEQGNLERDAQGNFVTRLMRDKEGNVVPEGQAGAKYTDEYNCKDFSTRSEAQRFFTNAGGIHKDTNRLDGDKDGVACEDLPVGSQVR